MRPVAERQARRVGVRHRRGEVDDELVALRAQQAAHRHPERAVLVARLEDHGAVEPHRRDGVETGEGEVHPVGAGDVRARVERGAVAPRRAADPVLEPLVGAVQWVGDQAGSEQVGVDDSRDGSGDRPGREDGGRHLALGEGDDRPPVVQRADGRHSVGHERLLVGCAHGTGILWFL